METVNIEKVVAMNKKGMKNIKCEDCGLTGKIKKFKKCRNPNCKIAAQFAKPQNNNDDDDNTPNIEKVLSFKTVKEELSKRSKRFVRDIQTPEPKKSAMSDYPRTNQEDYTFGWPMYDPAFRYD